MINRDLLRAREESAITKDTTLNPKSIKAKFYRAVRFFSPAMADRVIPYHSSVKRIAEIKKAKRSIEKQRRETLRHSEQNQNNLNREKVNIEAQLQRHANNWLFSNPRKVLLHALTYLSHDADFRNFLFHQYSKHSGMDDDEIKNAYGRLEVKTMPSKHPYQQLTAVLEAAYDTEISTETAGGFKRWVMVKPNARLQVPFENGATEGTQNRNGYKRKVIIHFNENSTALLGEISPERFVDLIRKSRTPLSADQIIEIAKSLSNTNNPVAEYQRYPFVVTGLGSEFKGFHVLKRGSKGRVLFKYTDDYLHIRVGGYYEVYGDHRRARI